MGMMSQDASLHQSGSFTAKFVEASTLRPRKLMYMRSHSALKDQQLQTLHSN